MIAFRYKLQRSIHKTWPDLARIGFLRAPRFIYGAGLDTLPVFTYHAVDARFEQDLQHLAEGGYRTVGVEELTAFQQGRLQPDGKSVVLTFDDGLISLTDVAVPLLEKYGFKAIAFVVGGLVPESDTERLAGWSTLRSAVARGTLQVGAHSEFHHHVIAAPKQIGWVTPTTDRRFEANIPVPRLEGPEEPPVGMPFLLGAPRYTVPRAWLPESGCLTEVAERAAELGDELFEQPNWSDELGRGLELRGRWETEEEADHAVIHDMGASIDAVIANCSNPAERHLCYPWYAGTARTDRLAKQAGVDCSYLGVDRRNGSGDASVPERVGRLPEEWLPRLPGSRRVGFWPWLGKRLGGIVGVG